MIAALHVQQGGLHTTVQDLGRYGWQAMGVPVSGADNKSQDGYERALAAFSAKRAFMIGTTSCGPAMLAISSSTF